MSDKLKCPRCGSAETHKMARKEMHWCDNCKKTFDQVFVQDKVTLREGSEDVREV